MSLLLTITAVVGTCAILAHYVRRLKHLSRWDHFPGFKSYSSIPLAGHVWRISNFLQHFRQMQADYGDMFRLDWGDRPTVYVCSHELASEALSSDAFNGMPHKDMMGTKGKRRRSLEHLAAQLHAGPRRSPPLA